MWDSSHTHTHHTINQIGVSQSSPLKSLTSMLRPTLWGGVSEPTQDYQVGSDTICNDPRKSASHIYAIPQKDQSLLKFLVIVNKTQIYPVNTRCGTQYTPTHITQSIKLRHYRYNGLVSFTLLLTYHLFCFNFYNLIITTMGRNSKKRTSNIPEL